jgi:hypothetical protein
MAYQKGSKTYWAGVSMRRDGSWRLLAHPNVFKTRALARKHFINRVIKKVRLTVLSKLKESK